MRCDLSLRPNRIAHLEIATGRSALEAESAHIEITGLDKAAFVFQAGTDKLHLDCEVICRQVHGSSSVVGQERLVFDEAEEG
jgi:hypothetical protein